MRKKIVSIVIVVIVIAVIVGIYLEINFYRRKSIPNEISEIEAGNINDYFFEYLNIMFPDYEISHINSITDSNCLGNGVIKCIDMIDHDDMAGPSINIKYNGKDIIHIYVSNFPYTKDRDYFEGNSVALSVCGPLSDGAKCGTYKEFLNTTCYMSALNRGFSATAQRGSYCPSKMYFESQADQITNYFFDGFMSLNIPYEFSLEYLESR